MKHILKICKYSIKNYINNCSLKIQKTTVIRTTVRRLIGNFLLYYSKLVYRKIIMHECLQGSKVFFPVAVILDSWLIKRLTKNVIQQANDTTWIFKTS